MVVRVLLFAAYREIVGAREIELDIPVGSTVEDMFDILQQKHPTLSQLRSSTRFAVNRAIVPPQHEVRERDEVAFLQPVSGGSND